MGAVTVQVDGRRRTEAERDALAAQLAALERAGGERRALASAVGQLTTAAEEVQRSPLARQAAELEACQAELQALRRRCEEQSGALAAARAASAEGAEARAAERAAWRKERDALGGALVEARDAHWRTLLLRGEGAAVAGGGAGDDAHTVGALGISPGMVSGLDGGWSPPSPVGVEQLGDALRDLLRGEAAPTPALLPAMHAQLATQLQQLVSLEQQLPGGAGLPPPPNGSCCAAAADAPLPCLVTPSPHLSTRSGEPEESVGSHPDSPIGPATAAFFTDVLESFEQPERTPEGQGCSHRY